MARRQPTKSSKSAAYSKKARQERRKKQQQLPPVSKYVAWSCYASLAGAMGLYLWACTLTLPNLGGGGALARGAAVSSLGAVCGLLANFTLLPITMWALYPERYPFQRLNKKLLMYVFIGLSMVTVVVTLSSKLGQQLLGPGLIPPVAIFFFVVRPRLKALAIAKGNYTPSRFDKAREDYEKEREEYRRERQREKEAKRRYEELKARRLGDQTKRR